MDGPDRAATAWCAESTIAEIKTVADAERRKKVVREKFLNSLGGLPDYNGPLTARITGKIQAEGYTIEKVIFESLPGFFVTANLYRPNQPGRYPAVLVQSGHSDHAGKPEPQRMAANLALKGFVALCFDTLGHGERIQSFDPLLGRVLPGANDHVMPAAQSLLIGEGVARYFIWDAKRALDYLQSRPDVDASCMGATGCSGGGALTTFIGALDPRLKAVAPGCFVNSYHALFSIPEPDAEMTFPRLLANGLDTADFVELTAPTPWLILATGSDYYVPENTRLVYLEARRWFKIYGADEKIRFFVGAGPHGTPIENREAIYEWMIRWLKDGKGDSHDKPVRIYDNFELQVTASGQVENEPGSRKVHQLILDEFQAKKRQETIAQLHAELLRLQIPTEHSSPAVRVLEETSELEGQRRHIKFESESGVELDGKLYIPLSPGRKPAVLIVADNLSNQKVLSTSTLAEKMAKSGRIVLEMEPRNPTAGIPTYSTESSVRESESFLGNWQGNLKAEMIGRNLPTMRAYDILRAVDLLIARSDVDPSSVSAVGRGVKGIWLLLAAASDPRIAKVWLDGTPYSLRRALEQTVNMQLFEAVIPGFVLHWDLNDLTKAMGSRPVLWTDPSGWTGERISLGGPFHYRYLVHGIDTDFRDEQINQFIGEFLR